MANFKGVAEAIRVYQNPIRLWDENEPVDLEECRGCGGRGVRDGMEIARLTAICQKTDCGPLENELVRLRAQIAALEAGGQCRSGGAHRGYYESEYAFIEKQLACRNAKNWKRRKMRRLISRHLWKGGGLISRVEHEQYYKGIALWPIQPGAGREQYQQTNTRTRGGTRTTNGSDGDDGDRGFWGGLLQRTECRGMDLLASKAAAHFVVASVGVFLGASTTK
jgi:hypothetical protein